VKASLAIAATFRERIARGELRSGDPLPVENDLMEELGVSKGIVREALRILENEGLVEVRRGIGGGPRVRHPSISEASQGMGVYLQIGDVPTIDVLQARDQIIGEAVRRLAEDPGRYDLTALRASADQLTALVGDLDGYYPQLLDVGEQAVLATGNKTLHVVVTALHHIAATELAAATQVVLVRTGDIQVATAAEDLIARTWRNVVRRIGSGQVKAATRAYDEQADGLRLGLHWLMGGGTGPAPGLWNTGWGASLTPVAQQ
jgi:DNA-binding FadR family transcriptional regulator